MNPELLKELVTYKMPYGKYKGSLLTSIPMSYLEWMHGKGGFPKGKLGMLLATLYEIKLNGLEEILHNIRKLS